MSRKAATESELVFCFCSCITVKKTANLAIFMISVRPIISTSTSTDLHQIFRVGRTMTVSDDLKLFFRSNKRRCKQIEAILWAQPQGGLVAEWLACWTQALKGLCSNRSRDAVG